MLREPSNIPADLLEKIKQVAEAFSQANNELSEFARRVFAEFGEGIQKIEQRLPDDIKLLATHGWFISFWRTPMFEIPKVSKLFACGDESKGNEFMCDHFAEIQSEIECELKKDYPNRAGVIAKSFSAHRTHDYELSIPAFLIQADGIAAEYFQASVFTRRPDKRAVVEGKLVASGVNGRASDFFRLVLEDLPLTASTSAPDYVADALNRHEILHGISSNYGTRLNSFRAMSFLQYAAAFQEFYPYKSE